MKKENIKNKNAKEIIKEIFYANNKNGLLRNYLYNPQKMKKIYSNKNNININIIFLLRLFIILISISFSNSRLRKLDKINELTLTMKGKNTYQSIISNSVSNPDEVLINGVKQDNAFTNYLLPDSIVNITIRWNSTFTSCTHLFYNFDHLLSVDFTNFDSSRISDMTSMFHGCRNLKSINFKNFNTSLVEKMDDVFYACDSLESLDLSSFNTSSVTTMSSMFENCTSLKTLDISHFDTKSVVNMDHIFRFAESLVSLDLSNLNLSNVAYLSYAFYGCKSLVYLNLNFNNIKENIQVNEILSNDLTDFIYCVDEVNSNKIYRAFQNINRNNNCSNECFTGSTKLIIETKKCIDNCENDDTYKYEYNNICYNSSQLEPENTEENMDTENPEQSGSSEPGSSEVEDNTQKDGSSGTESSEVEDSTQKYESSEQESNEVEESTQKDDSSEPENSEVEENTQKTESSGAESNEVEDSTQKTESSDLESSDKSEKSDNIEETDKNKSDGKIENAINSVNNQILENFSSKEFFQESIDTSIANEDSTIKDEIIKNIKKDLMNGNLDTLLVNVTSGEKKDLIATDKNTIYQITTSENQKNNQYTNISTVNLGKCEDRLKDVYGIDKNLSLLIFKIDYFEPGLKIPVIGYEIYHPKNKSQLDLKYCEDILVKLDIPVSIDESSEFKHDPSSEYYNDECSTYTTGNGTDILLEDRRNEYIDNNLSLCEANCTYKGYNEGSKKAICECESKTSIGSISDIINNENILSSNFSTENTTSNVASLKCTKTLFTKEGLLTNIGNYLLLFTFAFFIVSVIIFYKCGSHIIDTTIKEILNLKTKENKRNSNQIDIFCKKKKRKNSVKNLKSTKKKEKRKSKISNPRKKSNKRIGENTKNEKLIKSHNSLSSTKLEFKNTNIFINIEKNKKKRKNSFKEPNIYKNEKTFSLIKYKDCELNSFNFQKAIIYDKRTFCQYYLSLIISNNLLLFSFYPVNDYNLKIIKISLFFLSFDIYFFVNSLFFTFSSIHQIYEDGGVYNISYFIPKIIISFFISYYIIVLIKYFSLSQKNLLELNNEENMNEANDKGSKIRRCLNIKYIVFYVMSFIFLTFFWYYLSSFCAVYKNSQFYAIKNTLISFGISLLYPFFFNLVPCIFRFVSLKNNNECIYKINQIIQLL